MKKDGKHGSKDDRDGIIVLKISLLNTSEAGVE